MTLLQTISRHSMTFLATAAFGLVLSASASAQDLSRDIQNLKRDLADLQRYIYNGQSGPPPALGVPQSETQGTGAEMGGDVAARLQVRVQDVERRMRETTGKVEEIEFRVRQMEQRLETALQDVEFRLNRLEGGTATPPGAVSAAPPPAGAQPLTGVGAQPVIPIPPQPTVTADGVGTTVISSEGTETQPPQGGTLGTLIVDASGNVIGGSANLDATQGSAPAAGPGVQGAVAPPPPSTVQTLGAVEGGDLAQAGGEETASLPTEPQALYDHSLGLMRQGDYVGAESALRVFLDQHSQHDLVPSALYWLGETHYVRDNHRDAAFSFVDVYSRYPKSNKAPDSLLKLGMSLNALGNTGEACAAFSTLKSEYPNARRAVLKLAEDRASQYGC